MNALRWILTVGIALFAVACLTFYLFASNFRRSFGASTASPLLVVIPLLLAAGLIGWLAPWSKS
jgi:hypothetical protein